MPHEVEGISHLDAKELKARLDDKNDRTLVIDVREVEEYVEGHIPNVPLIPMGDFIDIIDQFDKDREYVFVCRSGRRSLEVARFFKNNGIENVHNYAGGMLEWEDEIAKGPERVITTFSMDQIERKDA